MRSNWKSKYKSLSEKKRGKRARQRKEKRYPGVGGSVVVGRLLIHITKNISTLPRIEFAFCAWPNCPYRAARDTHRRRCPLPHGVGIVRVRVVVGEAPARRRQRQVVASCDLRLASAAKKVLSPKHRRSCTDIRRRFILLEEGRPAF